MNLIIMPVRAHVQMTRRAVESCMKQDMDCALYIIDNGTTDGTSNYLQSLESCLLSTYRPDKGLHYVWNKALTFAFDTLKSEHALVINNDVYLRPDTYRLLAETGLDFVTGVGVDKMSAIEGEPNMESRSPHPHFSCFLMRRKVWETIGHFDESMRIYCGDGDYHLRMEKAGIHAQAVALPFYHDTSGTIKYADNSLRDSICKQADEDREIFKKKWGFAIGSREYYDSFSNPGTRPYLSKGALA